jgi:hypothetical protein
MIDNAIPICRFLILTFPIDFDNDELTGGTTPIQRTQVKKKTMEMVTNLLMINLSLTRGSHQA